MVDLSKYEIFRGHMSTLKETSLDRKDDGTKVYMIDSLRPAVNFDDVKDEYIKDLKLKEAPKSNDALMADGKGGIYLLNLKMAIWTRQSSLQ